MFGKGSFDKLISAQKKYSNNQFVRINMSKTNVDKVEDFLKRNRFRFNKTFFQNSFIINKSFFSITSSLLGLTGKIYMQDLASQIPVNCVDFNSLKRKYKKEIGSEYENLQLSILDMTASPGSKTTQIIDLCEFHNLEYKLTALEPDKKRLQRLINNIQKQDFEHVNIFNIKGEDFKTDKTYDIILLDAPCSGNLVGDRSWLSKRNLNGILQKAQTQKILLKKAISLLNRDGILIYSTCSLEPEENEENISYILNSCRDYKLEVLQPKIKFPFQTDAILNVHNKNLNKSIKNCIRIMPYNSKTQGFFVCVLKKVDLKK